MASIMLDLAILGLLRDGARHGYELRKQLGELLGQRGVMSFGSLYPALARLERRRLVEALERAGGTAAAVPSSGSLAGELVALRSRRARPVGGGRSRKVYGITDAGRRELNELLRRAAVDDRTFAVQVAFCRHLPPAGRLALFEGRRAELTLRAAGDRPAASIDRYLRSLRDRDSLALTHDLAWLDELIARERDELPQEEPTP